MTAAVVFGLHLYHANAKIAAAPTRDRIDDWALSAGARLGATLRDLLRSSEGTPPHRVYADGHAAVLSSLSGTYVETVRGLDYPTYVVLPGEGPLLYALLDTAPEPDVLGPLAEAFPARDLAFVDGTRVSFMQVSPYSREASLALPDVAVDWASEAGLTMLGYSLDLPAQPVQPLRCTTYWRVEELPPGHAEWYVGAFYHLVDQHGHVIANVTGHGQWAYRWQLGDVYVERISIPLPADLAAGAYQLECGLFDTIHGRSYALRSPEGPVYALYAPVTLAEW